MSISEKIQALIDAGNETIGEAYTDLTSVMQDLIDGYGGGAATKYTITYTLASHITSSNHASKIAEGRAYTTVIASDDQDYQVNTITVMMGSTDITATVVSGTTISIPAVTGDVSITATAVFYPSVDTDASALTIASGGTGTLRVKLHAQPMQSQTVALYSDTLTLSASELTFTTSNWDTYQSVTVTAPSVDATTYAYINLTNSDPMMTESTVMVTVKELGYDDLVDTTIPTAGQHTLTLSDFTSSQDTTIDGQTYVRLYGYNGAYTNVIMPAEMSGKKTLTCGATSGASASNCTFCNNTDVQYITFEDGCRFGEGGAPTNNKATSAFSGCTALIGVSNLPTSIVSLAGAFIGCTNLRFIDNLDELVNVTTIANAFKSSGIQYIQDLSAWTALNTVQAAFNLATLIKTFGMPELDTTTANATNIYSGCTSLTYGIIPKGVNNLNFACYNCSSLRRLDIFEDGLSTTAIPSAAFSGCSNLTIYCNAGTTTYNSLITNFGSSTQITIKTFGGATLPSIVVWGDSISSPNKPWIEWPKRLATQLGTNQYVVKNQAIAGEGSPSTTARQGGYVMTVDAFTIPATTTATEISITVDGDEVFQAYGQDVAPYAGLFSCAGNFNPCTIGGVSGTISRSGTSYYFTRLEAGTAVSVSAGSVITSESDTTFNNSDNVMLFYLNGNAGWHNDADVLLDMCQDAVDHFEDLGGTKYIIAGPAANVILKNTGIKDEVLEFETKAATAFGTHWLNLREYEIQYGLQQNNLTASDLDTQRMAQGLVPASLVGGGDTVNIQMYDGVTNTDENHPNVYGANTIMLAFYEKGQALGYWS